MAYEAHKTRLKPLHSEKMTLWGYVVMVIILKMILADSLKSIQGAITVSDTQFNILLSFFF